MMIDISDDPTLVSIHDGDNHAEHYGVALWMMMRYDQSEYDFIGRYRDDVRPSYSQMLSRYISVRDWCRDNLTAMPRLVVPPSLRAISNSGYLVFACEIDAWQYKMRWRNVTLDDLRRFRRSGPTLDQSTAAIMREMDAED